MRAPVFSASSIRTQFIDYFVRRHEHTFVPASSVVPADDPTLMFTNAGMNQFKDVFLGRGRRPYHRAVNSQKCIRVSGKHNDLEEVGRDTYHHTFFEMLGNWSLGDYFKAEAIAWAWDLLTEQWGLPPGRLHATYFQGDDAEGLAPDTEARDRWAAFLPADHIHPGSKKDNFWEMGDTGPCGPCSEIHIDLTPDRRGGGLVNAGGPEVIELWNLVFIQFDRSEDGGLSPLPARHVDTGMGLERIAAVLKHLDALRDDRPFAFSNYGTGLFVPLIEAVEAFSGHRYGSGVAGGDRYDAPDMHDLQDVACRVIADHIRMLTFAITDGATPSNTDRGYVVRRVLRRAARYGRQYLELHEPFLHRLVSVVVDMMGEAFEELSDRAAYVAEVIHDEEVSFGRTLDRGIALADQTIDEVRNEGRKVFPGDVAFRLYDTFGFPLDLTELMAEEKGLTVDRERFEALMAEAREKARAGAREDEGEALPDEVLAAIDKLPPTRFVGYECPGCEAIVCAAATLTDDGVIRDEAVEGHTAVVVLQQTPFYVASGGQVSDRGIIEDEHGFRMEVQRLEQVGQHVLHIGPVTAGQLDLGRLLGRPRVQAHVAPDRDRTRKNHTATHLLNWALRRVLGDHVVQAGSLVEPQRLRFDFNHTRPLDEPQIAEVERLVNEMIARDEPVYTDPRVPLEQARTIRGLRAAFGEKYGETVRVVSVGRPVAELLADPGNHDWYEYPVELCGGTHLQRTSEAEDFLIVSEESVAKGVRRIVALTGPAAREARGQGRRLLQQAEQAAKLDDADRMADAGGELQQAMETATLGLADRKLLRDRLAEIGRTLKTQRKAAEAGAADAVKTARPQALAAAETVGDTVVVAVELPSASTEQLRESIDWFRRKAESLAVMLMSSGEGRVMLVAGVSDDLVARGLGAGDWVKAVAPIVGGGGGGRPQMAQAGGKDPAAVPEALAAARSWLVDKLTTSA